MDPLDVAGLIVEAGSERKVVAGAGVRSKWDELVTLEEVGPELVIHGVGGETGLGVGVVVVHICRGKTER